MVYQCTQNHEYDIHRMFDYFIRVYNFNYDPSNQIEYVKNHHHSEHEHSKVTDKRNHEYDNEEKVDFCLSFLSMFDFYKNSIEESDHIKQYDCEYSRVR